MIIFAYNVNILKEMDDIMKITALVENTTSNDNLKSEHGLSLYIETTSNKILFDMGQTDLFYENAHKMNIDLSKVDIAVLSHGHYDHGGGLEKFLKINDKAKVYLSAHAFEPHYNGEKFIGLDVSLKDCDRLVFTDADTKIADGLTLYSCNDREREFDLGSFGLSAMRNSVKIPDPFLHEHYLLIEEDSRRVLISGCSHKGILNIIKWFVPDVLVGGFHFSKLSLDNTLKSYASYLDSFDTEFYTCHCTGVEQYGFMKKYMSRLHYISTGETIELA